jgi:hypothetical protein
MGLEALITQLTQPFWLPAPKLLEITASKLLVMTKFYCRKQLQVMKNQAQYVML